MVFIQLSISLFYKPKQAKAKSQKSIYPTYNNMPCPKKSLMKVAIKHADKIDPALMSSLKKAGIKVPGASSTSNPMHTPNPTSFNTSTATSVSTSSFAPIAPHHTTTHPTELFLKEKAMSFTGDDAKIKDAAGNTLFKIQAELLTLSQRRYLVDSGGNRIGQLRHKKLDIAPTVYIGTPDNEKKVALRTSGMFNPMNCNAKIEVDGVTVGQIKGNWRAKKFTIVINGLEIATIGRKRTLSSTFMNADSYNISVRPQGQAVDLAFVSLLAIGLDELYHDKE